MCLCGIMSAELDALPPGVRLEVDKFAEMNVAWLTQVWPWQNPTQASPL